MEQTNTGHIQQVIFFICVKSKTSKWVALASNLAFLITESTTLEQDRGMCVIDRVWCHPSCQIIELKIFYCGVLFGIQHQQKVLCLYTVAG